MPYFLTTTPRTRSDRSASPQLEAARFEAAPSMQFVDRWQPPHGAAPHPAVDAPPAVLRCPQPPEAVAQGPRIYTYAQLAAALQACAPHPGTQALRLEDICRAAQQALDPKVKGARPLEGAYLVGAAAHWLALGAPAPVPTQWDVMLVVAQGQGAERWGQLGALLCRPKKGKPRRWAEQLTEQEGVWHLALGSSHHVVRLHRSEGPPVPPPTALTCEQLALHLSDRSWHAPMDLGVTRAWQMAQAAIYTPVTAELSRADGGTEEALEALAQSWRLTQAGYRPEARFAPEDGRNLVALSDLLAEAHAEDPARLRKALIRWAQRALMPSLDARGSKAHGAHMALVATALVHVAQWQAQLPMLDLHPLIGSLETVLRAQRHPTDPGQRLTGALAGVLRQEHVHRTVLPLLVGALAGMPNLALQVTPYEDTRGPTWRLRLPADGATFDLDVPTAGEALQDAVAGPVFDERVWAPNRTLGERLAVLWQQPALHHVADALLGEPQSASAEAVALRWAQACSGALQQHAHATPEVRRCLMVTLAVLGHSALPKPLDPKVWGLLAHLCLTTEDLKQAVALSPASLSHVACALAEVGAWAALARLAAQAPQAIGRLDVAQALALAHEATRVPERSKAGLWQALGRRADVGARAAQDPALWQAMLGAAAAPAMTDWVIRTPELSPMLCEAWCNALIGANTWTPLAQFIEQAPVDHDAWEPTVLSVATQAADFNEPAAYLMAVNAWRRTPAATGSRHFRALLATAITKHNAVYALPEAPMASPLNDHELVGLCLQVIHAQTFDAPSALPAQKILLDLVCSDKTPSNFWEALLALPDMALAAPRAQTVLNAMLRAPLPHALSESFMVGVIGVLDGLPDALAAERALKKRVTARLLRALALVVNTHDDPEARAASLLYKESETLSGSHLLWSELLRNGGAVALSRNATVLHIMAQVLSHIGEQAYFTELLPPLGRPWLLCRLLETRLDGLLSADLSRANDADRRTHIENMLKTAQLRHGVSALSVDEKLMLRVTDHLRIHALGPLAIEKLNAWVDVSPAKSSPLSFTLWHAAILALPHAHQRTAAAHKLLARVTHAPSAGSSRTLSAHQAACTAQMIDVLLDDPSYEDEAAVAMIHRLSTVDLAHENSVGRLVTLQQATRQHSCARGAEPFVAALSELRQHLQPTLAPQVLQQGYLAAAHVLGALCLCQDMLEPEAFIAHLTGLLDLVDAPPTGLQQAALVRLLPRLKLALAEAAPRHHQALVDFQARCMKPALVSLDGKEREHYRMLLDQEFSASVRALEQGEGHTTVLGAQSLFDILPELTDRAVHIHFGRLKTRMMQVASDAPVALQLLAHAAAMHTREARHTDAPLLWLLEALCQAQVARPKILAVLALFERHAARSKVPLSPELQTLKQEVVREVTRDELMLTRRLTDRLAHASAAQSLSAGDYFELLSEL